MKKNLAKLFLLIIISTSIFSTINSNKTNDKSFDVKMCEDETYHQTTN